MELTLIAAVSAVVTVVAVLGVRWLPSVFVSSSSSSYSPQVHHGSLSASQTTNELCEVCHAKPKFFDKVSGEQHQYCGKTCARKAGAMKSSRSSDRTRASRAALALCEQCGVRPKYVEPGPNGKAHPFCGKTCAATARAQRQSQDAATANKKSILFYHRHEPHFGFTNFSDHSIEYKERVYPTSEHLFQSRKFMDHRADIAELVRQCHTPRAAFDLAHRYKSHVRTDWLTINISMMDEILQLKFEQHPDLKNELLSTDDVELIENSPVDSFWGNGADRKGRNELGKALMRLRDRLRSQ